MADARACAEAEGTAVLVAATVERAATDLNAAAAELARQEVERELRATVARERRKAWHEQWAKRTFGDAQRTQRVNRRERMRREATGYPDWVAVVLGDESMAQPDFTLPALPDPPEGEFIWGASLTCIPEQRAFHLIDFDADVAAGADAAVREAQAVFGDEHLSAQDLADVTGWPLSAVTGALNRHGGKGVSAHRD